MTDAINKSSSRGNEVTSDLNDSIRHSNIILANKSRFSSNVIERAIIFLSLNDSEFDINVA